MEINDNGGGSGTNFRSMSHQDMLAWVDQASSFYVQQAADKLSSAAAEMREIAQQLKFRPERVNWKGETPDALVEWGAALASSTFSLADYSDNAAKWMSEASTAISVAQSAIPRYTSHAQAKENLEAAQKYRNDPDSRTVASNASSQMANLDDPNLTPKQKLDLIEAKEEANRQAAAAEMEKLSQSYSWSQYQMDNGAKLPTFPPPPSEYKPLAAEQDRGGSAQVSRAAGDSGDRSVDYGTATVPRAEDGRKTPDVGLIPPSADKTGPVNVVRPEVPPADLGIDTVGTLPPPTTTTPPPTGTPPLLTRPEPGLTPPLVVPPTLGTPPVIGGTGQTPPPGTRGPVGPVGRTGLTNPGPLGGTGMPRDGISGGRQVAPTTGRPTTGIPRSPVIGTEHGAGTGRMPMGGGGGHMGGVNPGGQNGISGGRRLAVETGGVVGGRSQQPGATSARPFTPGGSGLVRGGGVQGGAAAGTSPMGRGGVMPAGTNGAGSRREDSNGERPDYLVEDEETWQQGGRRVAPPVID